MRYLIILLTFLFSLYASEALDAFKAKDYNKALKLFEIEAKNGESNSQSSLSYMYFNGLGTKVDKKKGIYWLTQSAQQNDINAQNDLGMMYLIGENTETNYSTAVFWLEKASEADHKEAQYNVALMYYKGDGTDLNVTKAAKYLEKSANNGYKPAQRSVGRIYMQLLKFDKAIPWLMKDADKGDSEAQYLLGEKRFSL